MMTNERADGVSPSSQPNVNTSLNKAVHVLLLLQGLKIAVDESVCHPSICSLCCLFIHEFIYPPVCLCISYSVFTLVILYMVYINIYPPYIHTIYKDIHIDSFVHVPVSMLQDFKMHKKIISNVKKIK